MSSFHCAQCNSDTIERHYKYCIEPGLNRCPQLGSLAAAGHMCGRIQALEAVAEAARVFGTFYTRDVNDTMLVRMEADAVKRLYLALAKLDELKGIK